MLSRDQVVVLAGAMAYDRPGDKKRKVGAVYARQPGRRTEVGHGDPGLFGTNETFLTVHDIDTGADVGEECLDPPVPAPVYVKCCDPVAVPPPGAGCPIMRTTPPSTFDRTTPRWDSSQLH